MLITIGSTPREVIETHAVAARLEIREDWRRNAEDAMAAKMEQLAELAA